MREYLKNFRKKIGASQMDIAEKLKISESYYSLIENGNRQRKLSLEMTQKISELFDVPIETIIEKERRGKDGERESEL